MSHLVNVGENRSCHPSEGGYMWYSFVLLTHRWLPPVTRSQCLSSGKGDHCLPWDSRTGSWWAVQPQVHTLWRPKSSFSPVNPQLSKKHLRIAMFVSPCSHLSPFQMKEREKRHREFVYSEDSENRIISLKVSKTKVTNTASHWT